jgi:hypothetical protein
LFRRWVQQELPNEELNSASAALLRVTRLYLSALSLPAPPEDGLSSDAAQRVDDTEWRVAYRAAARLPLDGYGSLFDPLEVPPREPTVGSVADDIADI